MLEYILAVVLGVVAVVALFFLRPASLRQTTPGPVRTCGKQAEAGRKAIPGWNNDPADPKLGDLGEAISTGSLQHYLLQQHKGGRCPVTSFWWRNERVISLSSPKAFKDTENLYNRPRLIFAQCFEPLHGSNSIQSVNHTEWEERKKRLHGTVRGKNLESFFSDLVQIAQETGTKWSPGKPINLMKEMMRMTLKAILNTSLGNIFEDDSGVELLANVYHLCKGEMGARILDVPSPQSQQELDFQKNLKCLRHFLNQMIDDRKKQKHTKKLPLLDALIESEYEEDQVMSDMVTFMGGFHTSAFYATWTFFYLAQHPDIQEKLIEEAKEKVLDEYGEKLKAYTLTSNSYLRQFLDEALRMSTTTAFSAHYSDQDMMLTEGYFVPAMTPIIHAIGVAMKSEVVWESPDQFNPDRFAPGSKHAKRGPEFRPFGVPHIRRCPANQFTYFMVSVYVTILLQRFVLLTANEKVPEKKYGVATSPKDDIHIVVEYRHPK